MPALYIAVRVSRWRRVAARLAIALYYGTSRALLHHPTEAEVDGVADRIARFMAKGVKAGRRRQRVRFLC